MRILVQSVQFINLQIKASVDNFSQFVFLSRICASLWWYHDDHIDFDVIILMSSSYVVCLWFHVFHYCLLHICVFFFISLLILRFRYLFYLLCLFSFPLPRFCFITIPIIFKLTERDIAQGVDYFTGLAGWIPTRINLRIKPFQIGFNIGIRIVTNSRNSEFSDLDHINGMRVRHVHI